MWNLCSTEHHIENNNKLSNSKSYQRQKMIYKYSIIYLQ